MKDGDRVELTRNFIDGGQGAWPGEHLRGRRGTIKRLNNGRSIDVVFDGDEDSFNVAEWHIRPLDAVTRLGEIDAV